MEQLPQSFDFSKKKSRPFVALFLKYATKKAKLHRCARKINKIRSAQQNKKILSLHWLEKNNFSALHTRNKQLQFQVY